MVNSNNVTRKFTMKEKLASLGPGFVIVGSFIGPGTVTSCTLAGATYGFTLFWCVVFSVIAVIVMQGMAARIGIITQEGLAENMKHDFADRPLLRNILCGLVIIAITIGGLAYMGGDLTGTAMGASALTGVPTRIMAPILGVIVLIVLLFVGDAVKYLEKLLSVCVTLILLQEAAGIRKPQIKGGKPVRKSPDKKPRLAHRHAAARVKKSENKA